MGNTVKFIKFRHINGVMTFVLPHPSPINVKWFKDHPGFEKYRLPRIRKCIHKIIANNSPLASPLFD